MLVVTSLAGNIFSDKRLARKYKREKAAGNCEQLFVSRMEMERLRLRRKTNKGTDIGLVFEPGNRLHHGDLLAAEKFIVVNQLPEKVIIVRIQKGDFGKMVRAATLIGHMIGNRHRPIAVDHHSITFPIQSESEVDIFRKLLPATIKLQVKEQVFIPTSEAHSHD